MLDRMLGRRRRRPQRRARIRGGVDAGRGDPRHHRLHADLSAPLQSAQQSDGHRLAPQSVERDRRLGGNVRDHAVTNRLDHRRGSRRRSDRAARHRAQTAQRASGSPPPRSSSSPTSPTSRTSSIRASRGVSSIRRRLSRTFPRNRADFRIFHEADWYGTEKPAQQYFSTGDAVYWVVRNGLFPMTPAGSGLRTVLERDYDKTALLPTIDLTDSVWDVKRSGRADWWKPFMAMSNAWYRAVYRDFETEKKRERRQLQGIAAGRRSRKGRTIPRYYFADQVVTIRDRADFVKQLTTSSFSSARGLRRSGRRSFPRAGVVSRVVETANTAAIDVESFGQGFLVMSVTPHKYWTHPHRRHARPGRSSPTSPIRASSSRRGGITSRWSTATSWCASGC